MKKHDYLIDRIYSEMFDRVGLKFPNKKLTSKKDWFLRHTWTSKEQNDFRDWVAKRVKKSFPYLSSKHARQEADWFIFNYGWKVDDGSDK